MAWAQGDHGSHDFLLFVFPDRFSITICFNFFPEPTLLEGAAGGSHLAGLASFKKKTRQPKKQDFSKCAKRDAELPEAVQNDTAAKSPSIDGTQERCRHSRSRGSKIFGAARLPSIVACGTVKPGRFFVLCNH